ncbi:hypothetical protein C9374_006073 [Naegleria lovaniensis]|uniref:GAIN-B domain-containing protein n=1 Tax=Naegleria lovaniensis TaxID=51637 RepID=A0AA88GIN9_NAELO|nr:uncharacterized protein C9374_006073 [Naegleria lovaniensis]KAG2381689.1 hypothetical protein C9374_006073 [Naegleria lovaniensis]
MAHDTSQNYSSMIDKIVVTSQNYAVTLPVLYRALTASVHVSSGSLHKVTSNLATALGDTILEQQQEISQFGYVRTKTFDNSQLMLNIISQMITFNGTENVREKFTSLLSQQVISQSSSLSNGRLNPSLVLNSKNVNITLSKVIVDASVDSATIENNSSYGDISLSLKSTNGAPQTLSPRNIGLCFVSLVTTDQFLPLEASSNTLKSLSNIYDFKFYENDQLVILQNLQSPIILKFKAMENTSTSSQKQWIACKYWDEVNRNWSSNGCQFAGLESATNRLICHCSHTTKFSTFLEFNMTQINDEYGIVRSNIISLFTAQIAFGSFFVLCCLVIFIFLIIFRNQQPVKSRLVTPYLGILALFVESVLIYVTHRSLIVAKFTQPIPLEIDENSDASYFNHIATILVNTLNLTAIFSYLLQVSRIQFMQHLYRKLQFNYHHEPSNRKTSFLIRMLRIMTSKTLFFTSLFIFALINILYWTLWVVLRRVSTTSTIFNPKTYVSIVSISYAVVILFCSAVISLILCLDFIPSLMREVKFHSSLNNLESSNEASQQKTKKHNVLALKPLRPIWNMDRPLYFRMEMILYLIMFVFLMVQQGLGLGCALFERFCVKEFSVENLYAWKYLQRCKDKLFGQDISVITEIVLTLNDNYLQSGAEYELNVPSSLKSQFKVLRLALQEATTFESKHKELIEKVYSDLIENLQMNLGDTFSRYENTAEYLSYKEIHSLQFELNSNVKIVEE